MLFPFFVFLSEFQFRLFIQLSLSFLFFSTMMIKHVFARHEQYFILSKYSRLCKKREFVPESIYEGYIRIKNQIQLFTTIKQIYRLLFGNQHKLSFIMEIILVYIMIMITKRLSQIHFVHVQLQKKSRQNTQHLKISTHLTCKKQKRNRKFFERYKMSLII